MGNRHNKCWFIFLLIIGIYASTTDSYGDYESLNDDDDTNMSKQVTFESLIGSMNGRHRVRRAAGGATMTTDIFTSTISDVSVQTSSSISSTPIYIITGYNSSGATTGTTIYTSQTTQITSTTSSIIVNRTYVITAFYSNMTSGSPISTTTTTTTTILTSTTPAICDIATHITSPNGTCLSRESLIGSALNILNSNSTNNTDKANAISTFITAVTNSNLSNSSNLLTLGQLDGIVGNLTNVNYNVSNNDSIFVLTQQNPCDHVTSVIGASFKNDSGPTIIDTANSVTVTNSFLSAAGVVNLAGQCYATTFNMLVINNPTIYQNIGSSTNSTLVSSIVIAKVSQARSDPTNIVINLYLQVLTPPKSTVNGTYLCAFYDTNTSQWNQSGCTVPIYNTILYRYECNCNHLSSFALIWLPVPPSPPGGGRPSPPGSGPPQLDAQDKASMAFQLLSILCFIGIITHGIIVRIRNPQQYTQSRHLLPLISCGITMILFIFYIALGLTVFTRFVQSTTNIQTSTQRGHISREDFIGKDLPTELVPRAYLPSMNSSTSYIPCLPTEHALMFIVYFLIIFMFCSKTSIGIDNYRRYVQLFPPPSPLMLVITMITSFFISVICLALAAGFNSNSSNEITEIYLDKICWFNRSVIHYFLTIPICLFLGINLAMFIPVVKHNITHARIQDEQCSNYMRRKKCIYILLTSCITQGFGWLFGPLILVANPSAAEVLGWLFIIFNGLEGVWAILLYIVIEKEGMNNNVRDQDPSQRHRIDDEIDPSYIQLEERRDSQIHIPQNQLLPLATVRSDSPRNSFADFSETRTHNRAYQANNNDRL